MDLFRASRKKRGPDPYLAAKIALFVLGAAVAFVGMAIDKQWVISVAIGILFVGFLLRFLPKDRTPPE